MPLPGLEIYKLLPQTNCKECGLPTCLAFAMKLAAKQAELKACPYVSEESKAKLEAASAPPIRLGHLFEAVRFLFLCPRRAPRRLSGRPWRPAPASASSL